MTQVLLQAHQLSRRSLAGEWLLHNVSLTLVSGQRATLIGPSGSGKTLLLRALARLDSIDSGQLLWKGSSISGHRVPPFRGQCIYLHQRLNLGEGTVEQILRAPLRFAQHAGRMFDRERLIKWLSVLNRDDAFLTKPGLTLSGGESQIVALLRAIQLEPGVLLLDEPTAALDADTTRAIERLVRTWLQESRDRATIWVSHDADQAERVADVQWRMHNGQLQEAAH